MKEPLQCRKHSRYSQYSDEFRELSSASRYFTMELGHPVSVSTVQTIRYKYRKQLRERKDFLSLPVRWYGAC